MPGLDILLVDASRPARYALRLLLQQHGARVRTAESAERALETMLDYRPDAVFAGCVLPGMNGLELLEILKTDPTTARIDCVICCPDDNWRLQQIALQRGALAILRRDRLASDLPPLLARILGPRAQSGARADRGMHGQVPMHTGGEGTSLVAENHGSAGRDPAVSGGLTSQGTQSRPISSTCGKVIRRLLGLSILGWALLAWVLLYR
jgi:CheY-like chemotaxis protein